ncbi:DUF1761 family protein [Terricaulis sp.]|uniref:DUF1761 family protein n=1 Tax=Terricaulis sp. TaxID=2768686 RepID=UPI0037849F99
MRVMGVNILAVIVAAIAIYGIEFVIFAVMMTPDQYTALSGYPQTDSAAAMARMPFGIIPPLLTAIGLALAIKWRNRPGWMSGLVVGVVLGVLFGLGGSLYSFVYGPNTVSFIAVNLGHYVVCWAVAGAVLGAWK